MCVSLWVCLIGNVLIHGSASMFRQFTFVDRCRRQGVVGWEVTPSTAAGREASTKSHPGCASCSGSSWVVISGAICPSIWVGFRV